MAAISSAEQDWRDDCAGASRAPAFRSGNAPVTALTLLSPPGRSRRPFLRSGSDLKHFGEAHAAHTVTPVRGLAARDASWRARSPAEAVRGAMRPDDPGGRAR